MPHECQIRAALQCQTDICWWIVGDSVTKQWRSIQPQVNGIPEVFTTDFGNYSAAILGVGGTLIS